MATSKTKQFCKTSFKNGKLSAELTASYQCVLKFSTPPTCLKYCACQKKLRSAAPFTQNHLSKPTDLMLQNATPLRKSAPSPPNISDEHVSCIAPATENASLQILFKCPTPAMVFKNATKPSRLLTFDKMHNPLRLPGETTLQRPKVARTCGVLSVHFDFEMCFAASRHNGVHFFDISTSKSRPNMRCFVHFDFEMCFAPQRRALFRHLNFHNVLRTRRIFTLLTLTMSFAPQRCAIFASLICHFCYSSTLRSHKSLEKTRCFATFLPFRAPGSSFFGDFLFLIFFLLLFSSLL